MAPDPQLSVIVADFLRRRSSGERISEESIIAAYPHLSPQLVEELRRIRIVQAAMQPRDSGDALTDTHDRLLETRPNHLTVRCPGCQEATRLQIDTPIAEFTCRSCGTRFSLVDQNHPTEAAPALLKLGRFDLIERLGMGGFGVVWKARDKELDRTVALKLPRQGGMTPEEAEKFFREARAAAQLRHPNIVSVHEVGRQDDMMFIVSEFVRGVTLSDWLTARPPSARDAATLCKTIAEALEHAHKKGVIHRDLKPANILIDGKDQPHLMDFGLARRMAGEVTVTVDGQLMGTPAYMSPEQASGHAHDADCRSDVYSLGVILFQLLTGELPFRGSPPMLIHQVLNSEPPLPRSLNGNVPRELETISLKCLDKDKDRRYQTAAEVGNDLNRFLNYEPIVARPTGRLLRGWRWCRRHRQVALLGTLLIVSLISGTAISAVLANRARQSASRFKQERDRAEQNLILAEDAVSGYLTHVVDNPQLKEANFHALRRSLIETALPFYEQFAKQSPNNHKLIANQAMASLRLARISHELGWMEDTVKNYGEAIRVYSSLAARPKTDDRDVGMLAMAHRELGNVYAQGKEFDKAAEQYTKSASLQSDLVNAHPDVASYKSEIARTHHNLGSLLLNTDDLGGARREYERALALQREVAAQFPNEPMYQRDLGGCSRSLGSVLLNLGERDAARQCLEEALAIQKKLCKSFPGDPDYRQWLARTHWSLHELFKATGEQAKANMHRLDGIDIQNQLVARFPDVPIYREELARMNASEDLGAVTITPAPPP